MTRKPSTVAAESQRLQNAESKIVDLQKKLDALKASAATPDGDILEGVAYVWREAHRLAAANPAGWSDDDTARTRPGSRPPAGAFNPARRARDKLEEQLRAAVRNWELARNRMDEPKPPVESGAPVKPYRSSPPKVRCNVRSCVRRLRWTEAWTVVLSEFTAEVVMHRTCPECDTPYTNHPAAGVVVSESGTTENAYNPNAKQAVSC